MRSVRVIPCLDVTGGRVVKGVRFVDLVDAGDPVELAARYDAEGADELTFLDITASSDERDTMVSVVARTAEPVFIPLTVGGGVRRPDDARRLLRAGADKVALNTAALGRPELVAELAVEFGAQCVVVAIDARGRPGAPAGRSTPTGAASRQVSTPSAGRPAVRVLGGGRSCSPRWTATAPATASTWHSPGPWSTRWTCRSWHPAASGPWTTWSKGRRSGGADAVLAASIFHRREFTVAEAKVHLRDAGVLVRPAG